MRKQDLTFEEEWRYTPLWKKALCYAVFFGGAFLSMIQF